MFRWRRAGPVVVLISAALLLGVGAGPVGAEDHGEEDGLDLAGATTYGLDIVGAKVDVEIRLTARNTAPNRREGSEILRTFFTGIQEVVASEASTTPTSVSPRSPRAMSGRPRSRW